MNKDLLISYIKEKLVGIDEGVQNNDREYEESEYNICDMSGGNFDDAFEIGLKYGDGEGKQSAYYDILKILEDSKG